MSTLRRSSVWAIVSASLLCFAGAGACSKKTADISPAEAAVAKPPAAGAKEDTTPPPGVDLSKLDDFERTVFFRIVNKEPSACGKTHSLIFSVRNDPGCRKSLYAVRYVARAVDGGYTDSEIGDKLQQRFRSGGPKTIDVSEAPVKGNPNAPVTLVEFADFECPACKRVQPVLRQVVEDFPNEVKLYFKQYPLPSHTNARTAAEAAMAAHKQGKFWALAEKIFANNDAITPAALEGWAKEVGLDVAKWRKDFESTEVKDRVQKDKSEGAALGIDGTPRIFINGRQFVDAPDADNLRDWINEELNR